MNCGSRASRVQAAPRLAYDFWEQGIFSHTIRHQWSNGREKGLRPFPWEINKGKISPEGIKWDLLKGAK